MSAERPKRTGLWLYAPTLSAEVAACFEEHLKGEAPSRNQAFYRYTQEAPRRARWLYQRATSLRAALWCALWLREGRELPRGGEPEVPSAVERLSEAEQTALLKPLEASLNLEPWAESLRDEVARLGLPPMRYELEVTPSEALTLYLAPVMHLAITRLDPTLGRALGDALDGPKP